VVAVPPGDIEPQFRFPMELVQALSEYTCKSAEDAGAETSILKPESLELDSELDEDPELMVVLKLVTLELEVRSEF